MALCGGVGAMALPSELIVHIFSFLSDRDKLRASAVCSRWRECLFYPALWTQLTLRLGGGSGSEESPKLEFLLRKFGSFVSELQLELAPVAGYQLDQDHQDQAAPERDSHCSQRWKDATATYLDQVLFVLTSTRNNRYHLISVDVHFITQYVNVTTQRVNMTTQYVNMTTQCDNMTTQCVNMTTQCYHDHTV